MFDNILHQIDERIQSLESQILNKHMKDYDMYKEWIGRIDELKRTRLVVKRAAATDDFMGEEFDIE